MNVDLPIARDQPADPVRRAQQLRSLIEGSAAAIEQGRQVTAEVQAALHKARLFRLYLPRTYGGEEVEPATFVAVIEELAKADASTAWCVAQATGCSLAAAYVEPTVAREIFGAPDAVLSWGPVGQNARAVAVDGGYRFSGSWPFASGSRHARWLAGHCALVDGDGKPRLSPDGKPMDRTLLFPKSSATIHDLWHVVGLKGTGSDSYTVRDGFVPAAFSFTRESADDRREAGPLYRFTNYQLFGASFAGVALGIARAALDAFVEVAASKVPMLQTKPLRESASVQSHVAQAEARLQASRALVFQTLDEMWDAAGRGEAFSMHQRATLRLAAVHAVHQSKEVVETAYHLAGSTAIFENQAFERRMRDMHAVTHAGAIAIVQFRGGRAGAARAPRRVETDLMSEIDKQFPAGRYNPSSHRMLSFHDAAARFRDGTDAPRAYLERCIERIEALEQAVMAFAFLNLERARKAADESGARYKAGKPLGPVDGMPVGIKDLIETYDMPTEFGSELFRGHQPLTDAASVRALRQGGAVLVGKTVTVCFGGGDPARTRNPFDTRRTPGGSSSGTAASVASRMLPVALGTHARGSTIRPASFCGAYALKPTFGAINRQGAFSMAYSMDHLGVFAGTLSDMWTTALFMAREAGGDPSCPGLYGSLAPPPPRKPGRLIRLDTAGWAMAEPAAKAAFDVYVARLVDAGVEIVTRRDDPAVEAYEAAHTCTPQLWTNLYRFEMHWPMLQYRERYGDKMPPRLLKGIEDGANITLDTYRAALREREKFRSMHDELAVRADGFVTLSSPGPGPIGVDQGSAIFNEASSILGAPAINLPLLSVDQVPLGVQLLGRWHEDERLTGTARWLAETHFSNAA